MRAVLASMLLLACLPVPPMRAQDRGAPPDLAALAARIGGAVQWAVTDPWLLEEGQNEAEVRRSRTEHRDFDRTAAMDGALAAAAAAQRPVLWYVPRIAAGAGGRQMYRPALLDDYARGVLFSDPELADMINRRFVPVRLAADAPLGQRFGIAAPETVEPAVIFLDPEGKVIRRVQALRSFNAAWFEALLRQVLAARPDLAAPSAETAGIETEGTDSPERRTRLSEALLRDGDPARVAAILEVQDAVAVPAAMRLRWCLLLASAHRRLGDLAAARVALDYAEKVAASARQPGEPAGAREEPEEDEEPAPPRARSEGWSEEIACERGRLHLLAGELGAARAAFAAVRRGPRRLEAGYHQALAHIFDGNDLMAAQRWKAVAAGDPASPYAWRAATQLLDGRDRVSAGPVIHGFEDPFLPAPPRAEVEDSSLPETPDSHAALAGRAVRFLLRMQRENGGWTDSRYAYWPTHELTPNAWVAATAVATAGLLAWRELDAAAVDEAVRRGEAYLLDERRMNRGYNEEIYADAYKLLYLARKHDHVGHPGAREQVVAAMDRIARELVRTQYAESEGPRSRAAGFWAHEYPNPFCTAAVMNALSAARLRGARVPDAVLVRGARALQSVRNAQGAFSYSAGRPPPERGDFGLKDSMARSPICEAALIWAGAPEGSPERLAAAMDNFWKYWPRLLAVRRCDFHTDGELAGFFFWHALFHTSEAVSALPEPARSEQRARLLEAVTRLGEIDGSFIDSHEMGKGYATGIALMTLRNLTAQKGP
jgi:hypothetical protein